MILGVFFVGSTLIFAVQNQYSETAMLVEESQPKTNDGEETGYRITAIEIPEDLNFAGNPSLLRILRLWSV